MAGPNCKNESGYKGYLITAKEMKGCNTLQCLVRKGSNWRPEPDDQDFELQNNYFLTGISDHMPSRDIDSPKLIPARHGVDRAQADDIPCIVRILEQQFLMLDCQ